MGPLPQIAIQIIIIKMCLTLWYLFLTCHMLFMFMLCRMYAMSPKQYYMYIFTCIIRALHQQLNRSILLLNQIIISIKPPEKTPKISTSDLKK